MKKLSILSAILCTSLSGMEEVSSLTTGFFPLDIWRNVLAIIIITDNTFHVKQKSIKNNMTKEEIFLSEFSFKARDVTLCRLSVTSKNLQKVVHDEMLNHEYNQKNHYNKFLENKERLFLVDALEDVYWMEKSLKTKWIYAIDPLKSEIGLETLFSYLEYFDDTKRAALKIFWPKMENQAFFNNGSFGSFSTISYHGTLAAYFEEHGIDWQLAPELLSTKEEGDFKIPYNLEDRIIITKQMLPLKKTTDSAVCTVL